MATLGGWPSAAEAAVSDGDGGGLEIARTAIATSDGEDARREIGPRPSPALMQPLPIQPQAKAQE